MLELRPNCECCDRDLPPDSEQAMICTYECTFCCDCVAETLNNVCPNCGGGFQSRPIRPKDGLSRHPASEQRVGPRLNAQQHADFLKQYRDIPPHRR